MTKTTCIFVNNAWYAYNFRFNLAKSLRDIGYKVIFVAPYDEKYSELIKKEFDFYDVIIDPKGINPISDTKTIFELYKLFGKLNIDILLNFTIKPNIYGSIAASLRGIRSINNITGLGTIFIKQSIVTKIARLLYKISLGLSSKVFFQNNDDRRFFIESDLVKSFKTDLLPGSGVDLEKFKPVQKEQSEKFIFLFIARLLKDKGTLEFVDAVKIIKEAYNNVEFQMLGAVGVQNKTAITKEELNSWVEQGLVNYLGTTDNVQDVIAKVDCVVLPSYREGTPRVLLEAAAMEKPIIATNAVGCKEVVDDSVNGYLCHVKDSNDLAKQFQKMLDLPYEKRVKMGKAGREKIVNEFDEKIVINKYIKTIKEVLK